MVNLPDFDDLLNVIESIKNLQIEIEVSKVHLKDLENIIIREATNNPVYQINGKPPSIAFLDSTYRFSGFKGELLNIRAELATKEAELENLRLKLDFMKTLIDVWRTEQANQRRLEI